MSKRPVHITCFSDILCVWAWVNERRMDEIERSFGNEVDIDWRFINLFGDTATKIGKAWADRGGFDGYADHVASVAAKFDHVTLHADTWRLVRPHSSLAPHLMLRAVGLEELEVVGSLAASFRRAFFEEGRDVGQRDVQFSLLEERGLPRAAVEHHLANGAALAALSEDLKMQQDQNVTGSPTLVLNEGRQRLFGNVGFRIIEANVQELLREPSSGQASWC